MPRVAPVAAAALFALLVGPPGARAQQPAPEAPRLEVAAGDTTAADLVRAWAALVHEVPVADEGLDQVHVRFEGAARLDLPTLRQVLDFHDVVLLERDGALQAHLRRNLSQRAAPPYELVDGLAPDDDRLVTAVVPIRHGAGASIFASVRGLLVRDVNRIGNILYVAEPDVIVLVDVARNVRYYQQVIARLDRAPAFAAGRARVSVLEVERGWWEHTRATLGDGGDLAAGLRGAIGKEVTLVLDGELRGGAPAWLARSAPLAGDADAEVSVRFTGAADAKEGPPLTSIGPGPVALTLGLNITKEGRPLLRLQTVSCLPAPGASDQVTIDTFTGRSDPATDVVLVVERTAGAP
jgi:hypothetical protein